MEKLKKFFNRKKHGFHFKKQYAFMPERVWHLCLLILALCVIGAIAFSWFFFSSMMNDAVFDSDARSSGGQVIKRDKLESVLTHYKDKIKMFKSLSEEGPVIKDPSL
jgi:hypothetical protein